MFDKIIFYNSFGAGDVYESREFIKEWMRIIPDKKYYYAHGKNPKIIRDIPEVTSIEVTSIMDSMRDSFELDGTLYVNTWIGRDGKYVLSGIGCTVEELYRMHNDILRRIGLPKLSGVPVDYIPRIDYKFYPDISNVTDFMMADERDKILIDNGVVQSNQAQNFDFNPIITRLSGAYPDKLFITVQKLPYGDFGNVISAAEIIKNSDGFDLIELAYLSHFCSCLIGRNSGPHVHTQNYANCMDEKKKLASFTYTATGSSFVVNTEVKIKKYWSPYENDEETFRRCKEIIDEQ
jgi:hypothetical protein